MPAAYPAEEVLSARDAVPAEDVSPLHGALDGLDKASMILDEVVDALFRRLGPVCRDVDGPALEAVRPDRAPSSQTVNRIRHLTDRVEVQTERLRVLLGSLDV